MSFLVVYYINGGYMEYVLVTGASSSLGSEIAKVFANNNYNIILGYHTNELKVLSLMSEIKDNYGVKVVIENIDITDEECVSNLFSKYNIKILINNAALSCDNNIDDKSYDEFMNVVSVNLGGTYLMCKYAKDAKYIINISSKDGIDTFNPISLDYCSSKAGIINLSKNFSLVYNDKKVYCVCPGWINTDSVLGMNPKYLDTEMIRIGQKELLDKCDVAYKIYSLINSDLVSGSVVIIDE